MLKNLITNVTEVSKATGLSRVTIYSAIKDDPTVTLKTIHKILLHFGKRLVARDEYDLTPIVADVMPDMENEKLRKAIDLEGNLKFSELKKIADFQKWELILENCERPQKVYKK